ncbi:MAG: hypothetical protein ACKVWR_03540, partial [Acidimicrobiales bacterium]
QVMFRTGDIGDAGSDDDVYVKLNDNNVTWIDSPADDFERDSLRTYDLLPFGVNKIGDITRLEIGKTGSDGWCLRRAYLWVNDNLLFSNDFGSPCRWLDDSPGKVVNFNSAKLRSDIHWKAYKQPANPPLSIYVGSRSETVLGHSFSTNSYAWGSSGGVTVRGVYPALPLIYPPPNVAHIQILADFEYNMDWAQDPAISFGATIEFGCASGRLYAQVEDVSGGLTTQSWPIDLYRFEDHDYLQHLAQEIASSFNRSFDGGVVYRNSAGQPTCPQLKAETSGALILTQN